LHQFSPPAYILVQSLEHLQWCPACNLAKMFLTSKFSYLLLSNLTHKLRFTGTANKWKMTNNKALRPVIMIGQ
jgi:hypothetical protein